MATTQIGSNVGNDAIVPVSDWDMEDPGFPPVESGGQSAYTPIASPPTPSASYTPNTVPNYVPNNTVLITKRLVTVEEKVHQQGEQIQRLMGADANAKRATELAEKAQVGLMKIRTRLTGLFQSTKGQIDELVTSMEHMTAQWGLFVDEQQAVQEHLQATEPAGAYQDSTNTGYSVSSGGEQAGIELGTATTSGAQQASGHQQVHPHEGLVPSMTSMASYDVPHFEGQHQMEPESDDSIDWQLPDIRKRLAGLCLQKRLSAPKEQISSTFRSLNSRSPNSPSLGPVPSRCPVVYGGSVSRHSKAVEERVVDSSRSRSSRSNKRDDGLVDSRRSVRIPALPVSSGQRVSRSSHLFNTAEQCLAGSGGVQFAEGVGGLRLAEFGRNTNSGSGVTRTFDLVGEQNARSSNAVERAVRTRAQGDFESFEEGALVPTSRCPTECTNWSRVHPKEPEHPEDEHEVYPVDDGKHQFCQTLRQAVKASLSVTSKMAGCRRPVTCEDEAGKPVLLLRCALAPGQGLQRFKMTCAEQWGVDRKEIECKQYAGVSGERVVHMLIRQPPTRPAGKLTPEQEAAVATYKNSKLQLKEPECSIGGPDGKTNENQRYEDFEKQQKQRNTFLCGGPTLLWPSKHVLEYLENLVHQKGCAEAKDAARLTRASKPQLIIRMEQHNDRAALTEYVKAFEAAYEINVQYELRLVRIASQRAFNNLQYDANIKTVQLRATEYLRKAKALAGRAEEKGALKTLGDICVSDPTFVQECRKLQAQRDIVAVIDSAALGRVENLHELYETIRVAMRGLEFVGRQQAKPTLAPVMEEPRDKAKNKPTDQKKKPPADKTTGGQQEQDAKSKWCGSRDHAYWHHHAHSKQIKAEEQKGAMLESGKCPTCKKTHIVGKGIVCPDKMATDEGWKNDGDKACDCYRLRQMSTEKRQNWKTFP